MFSATPMPIPPNTAALEPTSIASNIKTQILTGVDIDLSSLLSLLPPIRQINYSDFLVTLKNSAHNPSHIGSLSKFFIAFSHYSKITYVFFFLPHRRPELNDYLAIIAALLLSYGGTHFYTYHKLFSAKCIVHVAQWNQCPYWGALDTDLRNRVFLGCRTNSCAVRRSVAQIHHSLSSDLRFNSPLPRFIPGKIN